MRRIFLTAVLAAALLILPACGKAKTPAQTDPPQQSAAVEESWKTALGKTLLENYGILPESYEDLGNGIYQVYAEVGGEVISVGTVDAATGEFHWN